MSSTNASPSGETLPVPSDLTLDIWSPYEYGSTTGARTPADERWLGEVSEWYADSADEREDGAGSEDESASKREVSCARRYVEAVTSAVEDASANVDVSFR